MRSNKEERDDTFIATVTSNDCVTSAEDRIMETLISDEITKHLEKCELTEPGDHSFMKRYMRPFQHLVNAWRR